jgi:ribosomal protein S18 acetylase RimI-like enzyme
LLRLATAADALAVAQLGAKVFSVTFGHSCTPEQLQAYLDEAYSIDATARDIADENKDMIVAVAEDGTSILGFALLTRGSTSSEPCVADVPGAVELQRIYVDTAAHGKGVGKRLISEVEDMARSQGFRNMWLGVWEENHKAREIYEKMGYTMVGDHDFDIGGDIQTDHILLKKL